MTARETIQILAGLPLAFLLCLFIFMIRYPDRHLMRPTRASLVGFLVLGLAFALMILLAARLRPSP
jgi:hypothetical protein